MTVVFNIKLPPPLFGCGFLLITLIKLLPNTVNKTSIAHKIRTWAKLDFFFKSGYRYVALALNFPEIFFSISIIQSHYRGVFHRHTDDVIFTRNKNFTLFFNNIYAYWRIESLLSYLYFQENKFWEAWKSIRRRWSSNRITLLSLVNKYTYIHTSC